MHGCFAFVYIHPLYKRFEKSLLFREIVDLPPKKLVQFHDRLWIKEKGDFFKWSRRGTHRSKLSTLEEAKALIKQWRREYNQIRLHTTINMIT